MSAIDEGASENSVTAASKGSRRVDKTEDTYLHTARKAARVPGPMDGGRERETDTYRGSARKALQGGVN